MERSIDGDELMRDLAAILREINEQGFVYRVTVGPSAAMPEAIGGLVDRTGEIVFVLGPESILGGVFGLIDEEYGWPHPVQSSGIKCLADIMPRWRCHPVVYVDNTICALSVSIWEYERLRERTTGKSSLPETES